MGKLGRNPLRNRKKYSLLNRNEAELPGPGGMPMESIPGLSTNLFSNISIDVGQLRQKLVLSGDDDDRQSVISSKKNSRSYEPYKTTKKEKRQQRKMALMKNIIAFQKQKDDNKKMIRRQQTVIVGDLKGLSETLPVVEEPGASEAAASTSQPKKDSEKRVKTFKQKKKQLLNDIDIFNKVLNHPAFKKDPANTILEHLENKYS